MAFGALDGKHLDQTTESGVGISQNMETMNQKTTYVPDRTNQELYDLVFDTNVSKEDIDALLPPIISAHFEKLSNNGDMPTGFTRYRIRKTSVDGVAITDVDLMGTFIECTGGNVRFVNGLHNETLASLVSEKSGRNATALVMPLPFVDNGKTEGLVMQSGTGKDMNELMNYWGDNALVYFGKNRDVGIIGVTIGTDEQKKSKVPNGEIKATNSTNQTKLTQVLDPHNGYSVCQQISIMQDGKKSCDYVGQTPSSKEKGRRYRFFVETYNGTMGVVDFKEELTINQAISIMEANGVKNAVYADIIAYSMYFGDNKGQFYTRPEGSDGEGNYNSTGTEIILPNKNSIIFEN